MYFEQPSYSVCLVKSSICSTPSFFTTKHVCAHRHFLSKTCFPLNDQAVIRIPPDEAEKNFDFHSSDNPLFTEVEKKFDFHSSDDPLFTACGPTQVHLEVDLSIFMQTYALCCIACICPKARSALSFPPVLLYLQYRCLPVTLS